MEQLALVEEVIENLRLLLVALLHNLQTAHLFQPLEHLAADIDAVCGRCVVQGIVVRMDLISEHGGGARKHILGNQILTDNHDNDTCRPDVLLNAAVDHTVLRDIDRLGQKAAGNVRNKRLALCVRQGLELRSVDSVVLTDINIVRILTDRQIRAVRDIRKGLILRRSDLIRLAVNRSLLICLLRPLTRNNIVSDLILHQVHGNHGKLLAGSTL